MRRKRPSRAAFAFLDGAGCEAGWYAGGSVDLAVGGGDGVGETAVVFGRRISWPQ